MIYEETSSLMALRNSVKATLLLEAERPRSCSDEPDTIVEASRPITKPAPLPSEKRRLENAAQGAAIASPASEGESLLAAAWHARADELRAMADSLPSKTTQPLVARIADAYDEFAREAGWTDADTLSPEILCAPEEPQAMAAPADSRRQERIAFPRRPQPLERRLPRRRA